MPRHNRTASGVGFGHVATSAAISSAKPGLASNNRLRASAVTPMVYHGGQSPCYARSEAKSAHTAVTNVHASECSLRQYVPARLVSMNNQPQNETETVVIYARSSKWSRRSVAEQLTECNDWCAREGWTIRHTFKDTGRAASQYATREREGWANVKRVIANGEVTTLVMWEASRATRDLEAFTELRSLCRKHGIKLAYSGTVYDMSNRTDSSRATADAVRSEDEAEILRERVMRALRSNMQNGKPHGRVPYGYRREYNGKEYVGQFPDPHEAAMVREAATRFLSGESTRSIANDWNARGIATPHTGERGWRLQQLRRVLMNPALNAQLVYQGEVIGKGNWEPILDDDTYARVVAKFTDPSRKTIRQREHARILTGIVRCGVCGGTLRFNSRNLSTGKVHCYYQCPYGGHVSREQTSLDAYVEQHVLDSLRNGSFNLVDDDDTDVAALRAERDALVARIADAVETFKAGGISGATLGAIEHDLTNKVRQLDEAMRTSTVPTAALDLMAATDPQAFWDDVMNDEQRRAVLHALVNVTVLPTQSRGGRKFEKASVSVTPRVA